MREFELKNGIKSIYKKNENTPRIALSFNIAINSPEKYAGTYSLMNRLLLQGTKKYSNIELAQILDENAIELNTEMKQDYLRFRFLCLNEDFNLAIETLNDIINNSTFEEFEKEKEKFRGELIADLDSARIKISDAFTKTIYENHYYGNSYTNILNEIDNITREDVINAYNEIIKTGQKSLAVVGSLDYENIIDQLQDTLGNLENSFTTESTIVKPELNQPKRTDVIQEDANQAQIYQGWIIPNYSSEDYATLCVINTILGASGLSSRLFLELRDKKGLAYTVRTSCEPKAKSAVFNIYIATEPKNIEVSLNGFKEEIDKIKNIPVDEKELTDAKNNIIGKQLFITETNSQQANMLAYYQVIGVGFGFQQELLNKIQKVTADDILRCANKYFNENNVVAILHP